MLSQWSSFDSICIVLYLYCAFYYEFETVSTFPKFPEVQQLHWNAQFHRWTCRWWWYFKDEQRAVIVCVISILVMLLSTWLSLTWGRCCWSVCGCRPSSPGVCHRHGAGSSSDILSLWGPHCQITPAATSTHTHTHTQSQPFCTLLKALIIWPGT